MSIEVEAPSSPEEKLSAANNAAAGINKDIGPGSIFSLGQKVGLDVPVISTGIFQIDNDLLGCGGFPLGRMVELFGENGGGKSTLALEVVAACQKNGGIAAYIDLEHALSPDYANALGVDVNNLYVSQPTYGEEAFEIAERLSSSGGIQLIVIDSIAALSPRSEYDSDYGDANIGATARLMSQGLRKLNGIVYKNNVLVIWINQIRASLGITFAASGPTTPGGKAMKFYASQRVQITRTGGIKGKNDEVIANKTLFKCVKNRLAPPFRQTEVSLTFGHGFDKLESLANAAVEAKIIKQSGSWFSLNDENKTKLGQGMGSVKDYLNNQDVYNQIESAILNARKQ